MQDQVTFHAVLFHHIQFDRVDGDAFRAKAYDRPLDFCTIAGQFEIHPPGGFSHIRAPDVGNDLIFVPDLIDDRFFDLVFWETARALSHVA